MEQTASATPQNSTSRSAVILYSETMGKSSHFSEGRNGRLQSSDKVVSVLLAKGRLTGITTIGGRGYSEYEIDRLIREILEELRGIIDYSNCKEILYECVNNGPNGENFSVRYNGCLYCFIKVDLDYMQWVKEKFPETHSDLSICNELSYLEIFDIKDLIIDMVTKDQTQSEGETGVLKFNPLADKKLKYTEDLKGMFMSVGFDLLYGNRHNRFSESINVQVDMTVRVQEIPQYVSIRPYRVLMPKVYGIIRKGTDVRRETNSKVEPRYGKDLSMDLYIGDQFYFETDSFVVYRNGIFTKKALLSS